VIRIHKPSTPPEILVREGPRLCEQHAVDAAAARPIEFDQTVYAAAEVTHALRSTQHGKCCYCEKPIERRRESDVEHFRPKAEVRQGHEHDVDRPGYFWLAYDWSNLYIACRPCNQEHKGTLFPLADPRVRMRGPDDTNSEAPMFIDPGHEDPEDHITFDEAEICPRHASIRGDQTIRLIELGRPELNLARRLHFAPHRLHVELAKLLHAGEQQLPDEDVHDICSVLAIATQPKSPFTGMMRAYLRREFGDVQMPLSADELLTYVRGGELTGPTPPA